MSAIVRSSRNTSASSMRRTASFISASKSTKERRRSDHSPRSCQDKGQFPNISQPFLGSCQYRRMSHGTAAFQRVRQHCRQKLAGHSQIRLSSSSRFELKCKLVGVHDPASSHLSASGVRTVRKHRTSKLQLPAVKVFPTPGLP